MMSNLTELGRMVVGHVGVLRVLRVLRFPKLTQIQQDSTKKIICANLWLKKHQFNPLKPNLHLFKNIKIGVNGFQIGLNRCLFQHLPYPAAAFR